MKLARYALLALGMAGAFAVGAAMTTTAEARPSGWTHHTGTRSPAARAYRCCRQECKQWQSVPGTIGARCLRYTRVCKFTSSAQACYGAGPR
jgi:hypothetical protein